MLSFQEKKVKMSRLQHTKSGPLKLILIRPVVTFNRNYNTLPHNYKNSPNVKGLAPVFQTKIDGLTQSWKCFTLEKIERQQKFEGKEVVDAIKDMKINKPMSEEEVGEFLKLMKHSEYNVVE
jgi:hypothetical protein